jgi:hypothetical protein
MMLAAVCLATASALSPRPAVAQLGHFLNLGAGVSLPSGASGDAMNNGWLIQTMGGVTLPGGIVNLRIGGTYGRNKVSAMNGGTATATSLMTGVMLTPIAIGIFVPYTLADIGLVRASYAGRATSFAWQVGGGLLIQSGAAGWFIESRYMQARRAGQSGGMIPVAAGVRLMW